MSKTRLITLAGPLTIAVGVLWVVGAVADLPLRLGQVGDERFWDMFLAWWSLAFMVSFIPLLFALIGTRLRFHPSARAAGRLGLALSVAGGAGVIASLLARLLWDAVGPEPRLGAVPWLGYAAVTSFWCVWIGFALFGVDALKHRLLPRWNLLPLLLGLTVVLSLGFEWFGVPAFLPAPWATPTVYFAINGAWLVLLGIAMLEQRGDAQPAASYP